jgi:hypothetical protein
MLPMSTLSDLPEMLATVPAYPHPLEAGALPAALRANPLVAELLAMDAAQEAAFAARSAREAGEDGAIVAEVLASQR